MKRGFFLATMSALFMFSLVAVAHSGNATALNPNKSSVNLAKLSLEFKDGRLTAAIDGASLNEVVRVLGEVTGAKFVLIGEQRWAKQAIFA